MLSISDLAISVNGQQILKKIDLHIDTGETLVLFGPNGSGKTTLLMALMGFEKYKIDRGEIRLKDQDITHLPTWERVKLGLGMMFQRPPTVKGVDVRTLAQLAGASDKNIEQLSQRLNSTGLLDRSVNEGFSGGEIKRSELLQLAAQQPDLLLLDEPESGVDVESIGMIGAAVNDLLHENVIGENQHLTEKERHKQRRRSGLIITHTGYILDYISADRGIVFLDGHVVCEDHPLEILKTIRKKGFEECKKCDKR